MVAAMIQGVTGFGFALAAMPLLQLVVEPHLAVVGLGISGGLILSVGVAVREHRHIRWSAAVPLVVATAIGMPLGLVVLDRISAKGLILLTLVAVVGCTALVWRGWRLPPGRVAVATAGVLAGLLTTTTGTNGPPLVAALQATGYPPREFRATLAAVFSFTGVFGVAGFVVAGQVTRTAIVIGLIATPSVLLGWWVGNRLFTHIDKDHFRRVVLGVLALSCVLSVARIIVI
jgi:uncharacterized membrane protein YfcA